MTAFIEVTDREHGNKMLINIDQIIYVCGGGRAMVRYSNNNEWGYVHCEEEYDIVKSMLKEALRSDNNG